MIEVFIIPFMGLQKSAFERAHHRPAIGEAFLVITTCFP